MVFLKDRSRCRLSDARHFGDAETSASLGTIEMLEGRMWRRKADCAGMFSAQRQHFTWHRRSAEHKSELQSLMRSSYAVLCLKKRSYRLRTLSQTISLTPATKNT